FSPLERSVFQRLCDSWAPAIDAQRFLRGAETSEEQERTALERLMAKLRTAQIGVLTTRTGENGREPGDVILTSRGSLEYWVAVVNDASHRLIAKGFQFLPSLERMRELKALPPDYHVTDADSSHLILAYGGTADSASIYRLRLLGDYRVIFTATTGKPLVNRTLQVLRRDIVERGVLEELARLADSSITETRARLGSKAPDVWLELARTLVRERSTIAFRKSFEETDELFQLAYLVMTFTDAQIGAAREQKEHEARIDEELRVVEKALVSSSSATLTQDEFSAIVEDVQSKLGPAAAIFSRKLAESLFSPPPRRRLPRVLSIQGVYIHADRVFAVVEEARREMSSRLTQEYTELMEAFLRGRLPDAGELFGSRDMFNDDVARRVERQHPLLGELLGRPQLLAEAIIQDAKRKREGVSTEELKGVLAGWFNVDSSTLRSLNELFALNIVQIYDVAFGRVGVLRQILLRLSGRHESLRATYIRRFGPRRDRISFADDAAGPPRGRSGSDAGPDDTGTRLRGTGNRDYQPQTVKPQRHRPAPRPSKPRFKSPREIDEIWSEFDKALHTKPPKDTGSKP
ncbi:MAG: hypothetical protein ACOC37_04555, partial [Spirochaetota bacterium]